MQNLYYGYRTDNKLYKFYLGKIQPLRGCPPILLPFPWVSPFDFAHGPPTVIQIQPLRGCK